jgi:hypothetical protein
MNRKRLAPLFALAIASSMVTACKRSVPVADPCILVTRADVEKIAGTSVTNTIIEPAHAVSMAAGKVMHSTASCAYSLNPAEGKPARVKVDVEKYGDRGMLAFDFTPWKGAQQVEGIGEKAWQDTTALEILNKDIILVIETDQTPESPKQPIPPSEETRAYPTIQTGLARIALGRR